MYPRMSKIGITMLVVFLIYATGILLCLIVSRNMASAKAQQYDYVEVMNTASTQQ